MSRWKSVGRRIGHLLQRSRFEADLADEVRLHVELRTDELQRRGLNAKAALGQARREMGSSLRLFEDARQAWQFSWLERLTSNVRYGLRQVRRNPGFAAIVVGTLGLGIGANSAVFSAIDAVLLRPLPFPEADRLTSVHQRNPKLPTTLTSPARLADLDHMNHTFQALTGFYTEDVSEVSGELPEKLTRAFVAPRFLEAFGIAPALGRDFSPDEQRVGGAPAIVISDRLWRRRFSADPRALGRTLRIGGVSPVIVGIMPSTFEFLNRDVDIWGPIALNLNLAQFRAATWYTTVGRLKPNVTASQAQADLAIVQGQLARQYPTSDADLTLVVQPLAADVVGPARTSMWLLFGSASLLLLIACVNVAGLLLVRATDRQREITVRASLGASRGVIATQLLTETGVLALAGAVLGLSLAFGSVHAFRLIAGNLPRVEDIRIDWRVTVYTLVIALAVTIGCGLLPMLQVMRGHINENVLRTGRTRVSGRGRMQWTLAAVQVALAVVLLSGAGLLVRSFEKLAQVSPGFDPEHILTFHISGSYAETGNLVRLTQRIDRTLEALRDMPGVQAAATAGALPGVPGSFPTEVDLLDGRSGGEPKVIADNRYVASSYFATLRIPVVAGQACRQTSALATRSAVVNQSFVNAYFAGLSPIGHQLKPTVGASADVAVIEGVVGDVREQGLHRAASPTVYWCFSAAGPAPFFLIRTVGQPASLTDTVRRTIKELEPARAVFGMMPLADHLDDAYSDNWLRTVLLASFATAAVVLACVGLYGTLSYLVSSRRREIALRLALGLSRAQIIGRFFGQGVAVAAVACAAGLSISALFSRWLSGMLYGVSPSDPLTLATVTSIVLTGAAVASLVPSARGTLVEPMRMLRDE